MSATKSINKMKFFQDRLTSLRVIKGMARLIKPFLNASTAERKESDNSQKSIYKRNDMDHW